MDSILREIIANKFIEVEQKKKVAPLAKLIRQINNKDEPKRDFIASMKNPKAGKMAIIAEIKLASPSAGRLGEAALIENQAKEYGKSFADAISIVVDKKFFNGDLEFIRRVKDIVTLPILAKDFVVDPYQIYEMKSFGADAVLLMAKILKKNQLVKFVKLVAELGMESVVEVQTEQELKDALSTDTQIIAVNARDLNTFEIDVDKACGLLKVIPQKYVTLGFSGIFGRSEVEKYKKAGVKGVLVGTSLMKAKNIKELIRNLKEDFKRTR